MGNISRQFRERVETFLEASGCKPTEFGRQAVGDPSFVTHLRRGRSPTLATADKVLAFIAELETKLSRRSSNRSSA